MDFIHWDTRHLSPGFVGVCVVIEELVPQHQSDCQKSEFASPFTADGWVESLESVDEHEGQQDHVLANLGRADDCGDPFPESYGWYGIPQEPASVGFVQWEVLGVLQRIRRLEPEQACDFSGEFRETSLALVDRLWNLKMGCNCVGAVLLDRSAVGARHKTHGGRQCELGIGCRSS